MVLDPDDLSAGLEAAGGEPVGDDGAVHGGVPDIGDVAGEQRVGLTPVGAVVVEDLSGRVLAAPETPALAPGRLVADPVRGVGDHQRGVDAAESFGDVCRSGAVAGLDPGPV